MNNSFFSGKKVVVTGAGGFIGSHLTEKLLGMGAEVTALVRYNSRSNHGWLREATRHPGLKTVFGDIRDPFQTSLLLQDCHTVFHLAALIGIPFSYTAPQSYVETNLKGTLNILEAARQHKVSKIVLTSTSEVYGTARYVPIDESHPLQAQSPYSASKISADMMGKAYACSFSLPVTIVRPFNTFGPRQSLRAVIPSIIVQALQSSRIKIGDSRPQRDFNYVEDTVDGFIAAAIHGHNDAEPYNLATGSACSIKATIDIVGELLDKELSVEVEENRFRPAASEVMRLLGNAEKAVNELQWQPKHTFRDGLKKTIDWISAHLQEYPDADLYHS